MRSLRVIRLSVVNTDVLIIGGGAAGLFCAIEAGKRGRKVVVLEHAERIGKKIAISGGGRCNFTNLNTTADNFISANPHFCKSALARYTPVDFVSLVEKHGIPYHEKKLGQLFCDGSSQAIIEMLLTEASEAGVEIRCGSLVRSVKSEPPAYRDPEPGSAPGVVVAGGRNASRPFEIETNTGPVVSDSLVVATGGLSIPPLGATDFGYRLARQFGLTIREPWPALVPFTLSCETLRELSPLSGVSIDAAVSCSGMQFRENILITHRGLSGPAILQISSYWRPGLSVTINLLPELDALKLLKDQENKELTLANFLSQFLPRRFAHSWCALNFPSQRIKQHTPRQLADIAQKLNHWEIVPAGTEGYRKAEVTAGGIATDQLSSQTMDVKRVPGLYFIGEVVDVTGQLGGYNFQWAWASGFAAGQSV
jgi:predicted Rossmann fold flavoprotein